MKRLSIWSASGMLALACAEGGSNSDSACDGASSLSTDPDSELAGNQTGTLRQLRVDLQGTEASPQIVGARLQELAADAPPLPSLAGADILVAYGEDGLPSVAMPFSFPSKLRIEGALDGSESPTELALTGSSLSLRLVASQALTRIEVLGDTGAVLASLSAVAFEADEVAPQLRTLQLGGMLSPRQELKRDFPGIEFLGPGESLGLEFENPGSSVLDVVEIGRKRARQPGESAPAHGAHDT